MSYSEHFRRKILAKLEEGYSIRAVAAQFEINKNTIVEWKKRIEIKNSCINLHIQLYLGCLVNSKLVVKRFCKAGTAIHTSV